MPREPVRRSHQMRLFRDLPRRRGPVAIEFKLHCLVADLLRRVCEPDWQWTHLPFGEYRPPATAVRLKRMGTNPGWPDLLLVGPAGQVCWIELKRRGEVLSDEQIDVACFLTARGHAYLVADNFEQVEAQLNLWGVIKTVTPGGLRHEHYTEHGGHVGHLIP